MQYEISFLKAELQKEYKKNELVKQDVNVGVLGQ